MSQITKGKNHKVSIPSNGIPTESRDLHVFSESGDNKIFYLFFFNCAELTGDCLAPPELSAHIYLFDLSAGLRMSLQMLTASKLAGGAFLAKEVW